MLAGLGDFRDVGGLYLKGNSRGAQQVLAAWRGRGENQHLSRPDYPSHRLDELRRIVANAILKNDFDVFDIFDFLRGIAFYNNDVGLCAGGNRAHAIHLSPEWCAIRGLAATG